MSASMESVLKGYNDPRMKVYFLPTVATGTYEGLRNGLTAGQLGNTANKPDNNSHVGARWASPSAGGNSDYLSTSQNVMATAEAYFLRAEGALLGWNMGGNAKDLYEGYSQFNEAMGITDATVINNYIKNATPVAQGLPELSAMTNIPVKFGTF